METLFLKLQQGDPRALSQCITMLESNKPERFALIDYLSKYIYGHVKTGQRRSIAISGAPGVGKSTLIDRLGMSLINEGRRVAVLAIDPSSVVEGGSILGDKTRMEQLASHKNAFVRPSPSRGHLGGVNAECFWSLRACWVAGYDDVLVETVGVGQSEVEVRRITDMMILMHLPNAGDDLQGIKKGILEFADLILINKAEGEQRQKATIAAQHLGVAFGLNHKKESQQAQGFIQCISALENEGIDQVKDSIEKFYTSLDTLKIKRQEQLKSWLYLVITSQVQATLAENKKFACASHEGAEQVLKSTANLSEVIQEVVGRCLKA